LYDLFFYTTRTHASAPGAETGIHIWKIGIPYLAAPPAIRHTYGQATDLKGG